MFPRLPVCINHASIVTNTAVIEPTCCWNDEGSSSILGESARNYSPYLFFKAEGALVAVLIGSNSQDYCITECFHTTSPQVVGVLTHDSVNIRLSEEPQYDFTAVSRGEMFVSTFF